MQSDHADPMRRLRATVGHVTPIGSSQNILAINECKKEKDEAKMWAQIEEHLKPKHSRSQEETDQLLATLKAYTLQSINHPQVTLGFLLIT
jgi:hypothetical protein